jgi:ATP-dependent Clp protease adapter protein ClpS
MPDPGLHILMPNEVLEDQSNNITVAEVVQPERAMEFMVTVFIDGTAIAVSGPFASLEEAVDQANDLSKHYQLEPIYVRREQA